MVTIYDLMNKGDSNLNENELNQLALLAVTAEKYEDDIIVLKSAFFLDLA